MSARDKGAVQHADSEGNRLDKGAVEASATASAESPEITSDLSVTGKQGTPFSYTATATGTEPITWSTSTLPAGLTIDDETGIISGTPTVEGAFPVTLTATNEGGEDEATLLISIAPAVYRPGRVQRTDSRLQRVQQTDERLKRQPVESEYLGRAKEQL